MSAKQARKAAILSVATVVVLAAASSAPPSAASPSSKISPLVLQQTREGKAATFLVTLASRADVSAARTLPTKLAKGQFVFQTLSAHARRTQAPIRAMLDRLGATYRPHFLVNAVTVTGGRAVVDALAARHDVARIDALVWTKSTLLPKAPAIIAASAPTAIEWNISKIQAPRAWAHGFTGQGIVLGNIDTGQQWDHPALKGKYRGWNGSTADHNYNWYDATDPANRVPLDPYGHGTHTMGTMIGDDGGSNQIGVAPGAQWMSCRSMDSSGFGSTDTYITCFEFMIAPWDLNGQNPDPAKAPVAVSNSWYCSISLEGCTQGALFETVQNVRAAGIVPVVSAGNSGSLCRTIGNDGPPAQYDDSYTVGASTQGNTLASFSSRGPVSVQGNALVKPDIVAPGEGVRSSFPTNQYAVLSGTSMSSPHITGTIALIYSAKPQLIGDVDATEALINSTARHVNSSECSSSGTYPNNLWGYGVVNAYRAAKP